MRDQSRTLHKGRTGRDQRRGPGRRTSMAAVGVIAALLLTACAGNGAPEPRFDVAPYVRKGHVADCDAFKAQADAQAVLRADTLDPNELDRDGDGIACPGLPHPKDEKPVHRDFATELDGAPITEPDKPSTP
ncbi:excalibur calcium-binding domain-containing protein [Streptomyces sp. NBC_00193]|uniref:excalibur calcium-binding domain-containing protein n=1 Tax=Streptomyces sp. NBC_00193 TaxID=2975675 RepID=UPI0022550749|nr:excalibur calcium-binding domain-containing protein [Streptomyces sp. NBC_00193]MCX5299996.1 excalibur calcium-binding domain-containing protein [Streptomyces sp. NBC_00193]